MNRDFLKEAIADAKAVKESAIANAKVALEEAFTPQLKSMLAAKLDEMDSADEDDVKEMRGMSYEEDDDSMREEMRGKSMEDDTMEEMTDPDMRHGEDEDGKPETGALKATEKDREINEDEEVNLDEILAEIDNEISEDARTDAEEEGYEDGMEDEKEDMEDDELDLDDMSDEDLKSFIEDVIADMVSAGELEAGTEFEAKDEDEVEVEDDVEVEVTEGKKDEMKEEKDDMDEVMTSTPAAGAAGGAAVIAKAVSKAADGFKGWTKEKLEAFKKWNDEMNQPASPLQSKLRKAGTGKPETFLGLEEELEEAYGTIKTLKSELHEVNLLNAKLLYTNKIFKSKSLTESQKGKVLEAFDKANDVKGVKLVYETLDKNMKVKYKSSVTEGIVGSASKSISNVETTKKQPIVESNEMVKRFQKLAGIK
jgi:hypothetical protein